MTSFVGLGFRQIGLSDANSVWYALKGNVSSRCSICVTLPVAPTGSRALVNNAHRLYQPVNQFVSPKTSHMK